MKKVLFLVLGLLIVFLALTWTNPDAIRDTDSKESGFLSAFFDFFYKSDSKIDKNEGLDLKKDLNLKEDSNLKKDLSLKNDLNLKEDSNLKEESYEQKGYLGDSIKGFTPIQGQPVLSEILTFDGPVHHDLCEYFGMVIPCTSGGEDKLYDDSLFRFEDMDENGEISEGDNIFWMIKISDIGSSGVGNIGTNDKQIVFFLSLTVGSDGHLIPNPNGLTNALDSSITDPAGIQDDTVGIVIALNKILPFLPQSPLSIAFYDLDTAFTTLTHHWEMTLGEGSFSEIVSLSGSHSVRAAFTVTSSAFEVEWLPVDVRSYEGSIYFGDSTFDVGVIGGPASQEEQEGGWTNIAYSDFVVNPVIVDSGNSQSILNNLLTFDGPINHKLYNNYPQVNGGEDILKDDSLIHIEDNDNDGVLSPGDTLFWMVKISDVIVSGGGNFGTNNNHLVFFLSFNVGEDGNLIPNPNGLINALDSSITDPAEIVDDTIGIVIALNNGVSPPFNSPLSIAFYDLDTSFTVDTHHWEMTLSEGSFATTDSSALYHNFVRAAFAVTSSDFEVEWLPVDIGGFDGSVYFGDCTLDVGYIGGPASQYEQGRGWTHWAQMDFVVNPLADV